LELNGVKWLGMVLGEYEQKFNGKNRIALSKKIRIEFGKEIILAKGFDTCIFGFSKDYWAKVTVKELDKSIMSEEGLKARRKMFSGAEEVSIDEQGRIVIPEKLLEYSEIERNDNEEMMVIGAGDHLEIWSKKKWEEYSKNNF
jgi:MraZ protein